MLLTGHTVLQRLESKELMQITRHVRARIDLAQHLGVNLLRLLQSPRILAPARRHPAQDPIQRAEKQPTQLRPRLWQAIRARDVLLDPVEAEGVEDGGQVRNEPVRVRGFVHGAEGAFFARARDGVGMGLEDGEDLGEVGFDPLQGAAGFEELEGVRGDGVPVLDAHAGVEEAQSDEVVGAVEGWRWRLLTVG